MQLRISRITRDLIAGSLALLVLSPLVLGSRGGRSPELPAGPPDAGTVIEDVPPPDSFAPAGDGTAPKTEKSPVTQQTKAADPAPQTTPTPAPPSTDTGPKPSAPEKPGPTKDVAPTKKSTKADGPTLQPEPPPKPTAVEPQPKPVAAMTPEEVQRAVAEYRTWLYKGRIALRLDHDSQITPEQLHSVTAFFVLTTLDQTGRAIESVGVDPTGQLIDLRPESIADDMLTGDLRSRQQWPQMLSDKAGSLFGSGHRTRVKFYLSDECALRIYRVLAHAVGDKPVPPGTEFVLQLHPDSQGKIAVALLRTTYPNERTQRP